MIIRMVVLARNAAKAKSASLPQFYEKYPAAEQNATFLRLWGVLMIPRPPQTRQTPGLG
jgi:hypothetical protein